MARFSSNLDARLKKSNIAISISVVTFSPWSLIRSLHCSVLHCSDLYFTLSLMQSIRIMIRSQVELIVVKERISSSSSSSPLRSFSFCFCCTSSIGDDGSWTSDRFVPWARTRAQIRADSWRGDTRWSGAERNRWEIGRINRSEPTDAFSSVDDSFECGAIVSSNPSFGKALSPLSIFIDFRSRGDRRHSLLENVSFVFVKVKVLTVPSISLVILFLIESN